MRRVDPADALAARRRTQRTIALVVAFTLMVLGAVAGWVWWRAQQAVDDATQGQGGAAVDILSPAPLKGEAKGRVNVLLAGNSFDENGHEGAALTDSVMVASMNLTTKNVTLISIPRDLWVEYEGKPMKINAVYPVAASGDAGASGLGDTNAGMRELGKVTERVTGLTIDHHVLVGYTALKDTVNAVGGIDVVIKGTEGKGIHDPAAGVTIGEGPQHIDGLTALRISRARNDHQVAGNEGAYGVADNDYGRTRNQRMIMAALQTKVKNSATLANPATLVGIFDTVGKNVRTDLTVHQLRRVFDLTSGSADMASVSIKGAGQVELLKDYKQGRLDALVPRAGKFDYTAIRDFVSTSLR